MRHARTWALRLSLLRLIAGLLFCGVETEASNLVSDAMPAGKGSGRGRLAGDAPEVGLTFEVTARAGRVQVNLTFADKRATLRWASAQSFEVRLSFADGPPSACTTLSAEDARILEAFGARAQEEGSHGPLGLYLLGAVQVFRDWPEGLPVCLSREGAEVSMLLPDGQPVALRREATGVQAALSGVNICDKFGQPHTARYPTAVRFPFTPINFVEAVRVVGSKPCLGRCGRGCLGDGFPEGFNIYTQACFNHDVCVDSLGLLAVPCALIFPDVVADTLLFFLFPCDAPPNGLP